MLKRSLRWMLAGIFLGIAAVWCVVLGGNTQPFVILGGLILPVLALVCFVTGFFESGPSGRPEDDRGEGEDAP